jgi:hypothetical protein
MVQQHTRNPDILLFQFIYKIHFKLRLLLLCSRALARS